MVRSLVDIDKGILKLLHPEIQEAIKKKWKDHKEFRDVQRKSIPVITSGKSCLIISPTAGGKTEAAFLPVLSNIYETAVSKREINVIMVAPLKALLNDLEVRLQEWLDVIDGITLFKWHGDVSPGKKNKQRQKPASILLTTPESLDVMLVSQSINNSEYFCEVRAVIVDEAHYFASDSRGAQLASTLERIQKVALNPIQRIGLSATVGDPGAVSNWLSGSGPECGVVRAQAQKRNIEIKHILIDEDREDYEECIKQTLTELTCKGKTIIFSNSRKDVEMTARLLDDIEIPVMVHHGSVSKVLREEYEGIMRDYSGDAVISATSTLELGIDIGDLSRVIQRDTLPSVNSFLQRIGRAGRKDGNAQIGLITSSFDDFVLNLAMASLGLQEYNEPLRPSRRRYDILFQQLLLEILSNYGISADAFFEKVRMAYSFQEISRSDLDVLIKYWLEHNYIQRDGSVLIIGAEIEKTYGSRNYMELYSVFDVNEFYTVFYQDEEIGLIESWFAFHLTPEDSVFQLAGRKWKVVDVISEIKRVSVLPAMDALPPLWRGGGKFIIEYEVARRYQDILQGVFAFPDDKSIKEALITLELFKRGITHKEVPEGFIGICKVGKDVWIETYAGSMINSVLCFALTDAFPDYTIINDFRRIEISSRRIVQDKLMNTLEGFFETVTSWSYDEWVVFLQRHLSDMQYSRFSPYIPLLFSVHHSANAFFLLDSMKLYIGKLNKEMKFIFSEP